MSVDLVRKLMTVLNMVRDHKVMLTECEVWVLLLLIDDLRDEIMRYATRK